jgi:hypothetical protein
VWFGWSVALAQSTSTFCGGGLPSDTLPRNGDDDVPPGVVIALDFTQLGPSCTPPPVEVALRDADGAEVPTRVAPLDNRVTQVFPEAPLEPGYYSLTVEGASGGSGGYYSTDGAAEVWFRVADVPVEAPGRVEALDLSLRRRCNSTFLRPSVAGRAHVDEPLRGVLRTRGWVDGIAGRWHTAALLSAGVEEYPIDELVPSGLHEVCVEAELLDLTGDSVDSAGPRCFSSRSCPVQPDRGLCASAPGGSGVGVVLAAAALVARRRVARAPGGADPRPGYPSRPATWQDAARRN